MGTHKRMSGSPVRLKAVQDTGSSAAKVAARTLERQPVTVTDDPPYLYLFIYFAALLAGVVLMRTPVDDSTSIFAGRAPPADHAPRHVDVGIAADAAQSAVMVIEASALAELDAP